MSNFERNFDPRQWKIYPFLGWIDTCIKKTSREGAKVFYKKWWIGMVAFAVRMRREKEDIFKHAWESRSFEAVNSGVPGLTMPVNPADPVILSNFCLLIL